MMARTYAQLGIMERPRGVPPPGKLGASRNEMFALLLALAVFMVMLIGFWLQTIP
jgi:hypothetical protein